MKVKIRLQDGSVAHYRRSPVSRRVRGGRRRSFAERVTCVFGWIGIALTAVWLALVL